MRVCENDSCVCVCVFCVAERHIYICTFHITVMCSKQDIKTLTETLTGASSFTYIVALQPEIFALVIGKSKENNINDWEGQMYSVCHCMCTVHTCHSL